MRSESVMASMFALYLMLLVVAFIGWIINIVDVIQHAMAGADVTLLFVVKLVGILVAPLGAIMGLFF